MSTGALAKKLAEVMGVANRIPKRGRNDFHKYDYATEADIAEAIRKELAERHVILVPSINKFHREPVGDKGSVLTTLEMEFTFIDGDTGESLTRLWLGAGADKEDKGIWKAVTGGVKYFLLKTFLLPTGDDPELDDKAQLRERDKATAKPTAAERKARPPAPEGYVYIDKVVPRSRGNQEWADVILSTGEEAFIHKPQLISLAVNVAQENAPVTVTAHLNNKGKTEIDNIERWHAVVQGNTVGKELTAADIAF